MLWFFSWYLTITLLGWLTFPLVFRLFPALADRGYSLSRAAGLLVWGYVFWLLTSLGLSQNDAGGLLLGLLILAGLSVWAYQTVNREQKAVILDWLRDNHRLILNVEISVFPGLCFSGLCTCQQP